MQHVFIIGAKGFVYGGYETFLDRLTEYHQYEPNIKYHIACKANGKGTTDETKLKDVKIISDTEYEYHNAHCFKIKSLEIGAAQAIIYDLLSLHYCVKYIKKHKIQNPIVYVLSSRVGPFMWYYSKLIHKLGGKYFNNPDGRENLRKLYSPKVRKYWTLSEKGMVKHSDLVICDSVNIEKYIKEEYKEFNPNTTYIAYGTDINKSKLQDNDPKYVSWLKDHDLRDHEFYCSVGRFVPENNFEIMIREFMQSKTKKDFAIITTRNDEFLASLDQKLHFSSDKRIKFVGAVYDRELLLKIRENAYGYFHGHEVGGTNPSLLEALAATKLNLLLDVCFNQEVGGDGAFYWTKDNGSLSNLIDKSDSLSKEDILSAESKAKQRISEKYTWDIICDSYKQLFLNRA